MWHRVIWYIDKKNCGEYTDTICDLLLLNDIINIHNHKNLRSHHLFTQDSSTLNHHICSWFSQRRTQKRSSKLVGSFHVELMLTENFKNSLLDTGFLFKTKNLNESSSARDGTIKTEARYANDCGGRSCNTVVSCCCYMCPDEDPTNWHWDWINGYNSTNNVFVPTINSSHRWRSCLV
jgi:hypothetical protein